MKRFLRENWIWIVAPLVLVAIGMAALLLTTGADSEPGAFIYPLG
jgi:hypothetical protein